MSDGGSKVFMKRAFAIAVIIAVFASARVFAGSGIKWYTLHEGIERSAAEKKPMIVDFFYGKGCPRCEAMQKYVYDDPAIAAKVMADFIPVRIDLTKKLTAEEERLGKRFDFKNDCLLLFLDHHGELINHPGGTRLCFVNKVDPDRFVKYLDTVTAGYRKN